MGSMEAAEKGVGAHAGLQVRLLGGFGLSFDGEPVTSIDAPRLQSLLAYLALNRGVDQPRERLAYLFWPDSDEAQARTNLRQALHLLRRALPESERFLETEARVVRWRADAPVELDVAEFQRFLGRAGEAADAGAADDQREALEGAVALYAGDLIPDCYDDWVVEDRERLREAYAGAAERLAELLELAREYRGAIPLTRQLVDRDPLNEAFCRRLMRLQALSGDRAAALRVYHGLATALAREMGVEPRPDTREEYERLLEPAEGEPAKQGPSPAAGSPLIGRDAEWEALRAGWRRAAGGESVLGVVSGEAGIGKSRLCEELCDWVVQQGFAAAASRCYSAAGGLAYAPIVELLRSPAVTPGLRRLADPWLVELARLLPELLDQRPDLSPPAPLGDDSQRVRLLDALSNAVLAEGGPLLIAIDDLQWCDSETLDWLHYLLRSRPDAPLLVLASARSEELGPDHPAQPLLVATRTTGQAVELELEPLDPADTAVLAANVAGGELDDERQQLLHRETEGNPLFVVEWMRAGLIDDLPAAPEYEQEPSPRELPPRAHAVIEARLAQLTEDGQELASLAATVGRAFTFEVLAAASSRGEDQVVEALDELWERRIVREQGRDAYDFSHDKLREAAYLRAGSARRRILHRRVAQALERLYGADLDGVSGQLAAHYERAGWIERAIRFYARAAELAQSVYANERAIALFSKALELLADEPHTPERDRRELALRTSLGAPLVAFKGYGAVEVQDVYRRAWELCERLGTEPDSPVMRALGLVNLVQGDLRGAYELGRRLLERGEREGDQMVRVEGNYLMGVSSFWLGDFAAARDQLEAAIAEYRPDTARAHLALYSQDPRVVCLSRLAYVLWFLGEPEQAEQKAQEALGFGDELEHPFSLAYALHFGAWLSIHLEDDTRACERAERMAVLAEEQQLGFLQPMGSILRGWMLAGEGRSDEAVALIRGGIDTYAESGWTLYEPHSLALLARVCLDAGRMDDARAAISQALELSDRIGQRCFDAELQLLRAELTLAEGGDRDQAESQLTTALETARQQDAAPFAERASERLAQLRRPAP